MSFWLHSFCCWSEGWAPAIRFNHTNCVDVICYHCNWLSYWSRYRNCRVIECVFLFSISIFSTIFQLELFNMVIINLRISFCFLLDLKMYPSLWKYVCIINNVSIVSVSFHCCCSEWDGWHPVNPFNHTSRIAVTIPTDSRSAIVV